MALKYQKRAVKYTDDHGESNEQCSKCRFFAPAPSICRVVLGPINPDGWCMKFLDKDTGARPKK